MGAALIPLDVKPAQIDSPMQTIGGLMQMRSQITENALRQAQTQAQIAQTADVQAQAAQRQRAMQDQNTLQQMLADQQHPEYAKALGSGDTSFLNGKVSPQFQATISNQMVENLKNRAALTGTQLDNNVKAHDTIEQGLMGLQGLPSNADRVQQLHSLVGQWQQAGYLKDLPNAVQMAQQYDGSPEMTQKFASVNGLLYGMNQKAAAMQKEQADTAEAAGKGAEASAHAKVLASQAQIEQMKAKAMADFQANPQAGANAIDGILPTSVDAKANAAYKAAFSVAMANGGPDAAKAIIEAAASHAGQIATATNPQIRQAKVADAVATEQATAPIKTATAVATQIALNKASGAALAGVPPHLVVPATAAYTKAGEEYTTAVNAANEMKSIIDMARSGNKVAYAYAPTTGVLTINSANGVKRVNMPEIASYSGAGSLVDRVTGWLGKQTSGASIPDDVLNDMDALHSQLGSVAQQHYANNVDVVNKAYGSKFEPIQLGTNSGAASYIRTVGTIRARDPQGRLHEAPAGTKLPAGWKAEP